MCLDAPRLVGFIALVEHAQDGMAQPWIGQGDLTAQPEPRATLPLTFLVTLLDWTESASQSASISAAANGGLAGGSRELDPSCPLRDAEPMCDNPMKSDGSRKTELQCSTTQDLSNRSGWGPYNRS